MVIYGNPFKNAPGRFLTWVSAEKSLRLTLHNKTDIIMSHN